MREYERGEGVPSLRPKAARPDPAADAHVLDAAVTGRRDALDPAAVLGLQRVVGNAGTSAALEERSPVLDVVGSGGGAPLAPAVRTEMEGRLGHDFGDVRVHSDSAAHESATGVNAHAYTVGSSVVFQRDRYDPVSSGGKTMLAHELTHVVQQRGGLVDGTEAPGGIRVSDPSDRFEREAAETAERAMAAPVVAAPSAPPAGAVQRESAPEEEKDEAVLGDFVQRDAAPAGEDEDREDDNAPVQGGFVQGEPKNNDENEEST